MSKLSLRPQPLGIFPLPAGYLVLPPASNAESALSQLLHGQLPAQELPEWKFYTLALANDLEGAYASLTDENSLEARYNRFVLKSSEEDYYRLKDVLTGELRLLLDLVAYTLGYLDQPPTGEEAQAELKAFMLMAQATARLEQDRSDQAVALLKEAIEEAGPVSPIFAAQLKATLADTRRTLEGASYPLIQEYQDVLRVIEPTALQTTRGEVWLSLGMAYQEFSGGNRLSLLEAARCYQEAGRLLSKEEYPEMYALAQSNLALAYLAMPLQEASDQLRKAIAVQALREALKIYKPETHPEMWASTQLNLANALVYLPSSHPQENLVQAVELYEELLMVRNPHYDPLGYARLLANQGNALAHLGIFAHALPKLQEARQLFEQYGEAEAALSVAALLKEMENSTSVEVGGN